MTIAARAATSLRMVNMPSMGCGLEENCAPKPSSEIDVTAQNSCKKMRGRFSETPKPARRPKPALGTKLARLPLIAVPRQRLSQKPAQPRDSRVDS
jgi:hypothetical protein